MALRRWASALLPLLLACSSATEGEDTEGALATQPQTVGTLIPETAPAQAIVLANADAFAGINELHYTLLRGLFGEPTLNDVKVVYLSDIDFDALVTPVRAKDGDRLMGRFSTRFASEIRSGRLKKTAASVDTNWARDYFPMALKTTANTKHMARFDYTNMLSEHKMSTSGATGEAAARTLGYEVDKSDIAMEGGNVMIDDDATLFTTTKVLARNKTKTKPVLEAELKRHMGAREIEWLEPLPGEATGHVDIVAKVMGQKRVIVGASDGQCGDDAPEFCPKRKGALDEVAQAFERRGYQVTRITNAESGGDVRPLTYTNSLLVNGAAFVPMYFDPTVASDITNWEGPGVPAKAIVKTCNTSHPFSGASEQDADRTVRERAICALDGVAKALRATGEASSAAYLEYSLLVATRDADATAAYTSLGYRVVPVAAAAMINFGGSVHCVTMQIPKQ